MIIDRCQRWKDRRSMFRLVGDRFDPARHSVDIIARNPAIDFVTSHHYSGTFPTNRLNVGIFRGRRLAGVATFSVPARGTIPLRAGLPDNHGVELGRFVLLDEVEANAETFCSERPAHRKQIKRNRKKAGDPPARSDQEPIESRHRPDFDHHTNWNRRVRHEPQTLAHPLAADQPLADSSLVSDDGNIEPNVHPFAFSDAHPFHVALFQDPAFEVLRREH